MQFRQIKARHKTLRLRQHTMNGKQCCLTATKEKHQTSSSQFLFDLGLKNSSQRRGLITPANRILEPVFLPRSQCQIPGYDTFIAAAKVEMFDRFVV